MIDAVDYEILLSLQENPFSTLSTIADKVNLHPSTVSKRITELEENELAFTRVHADLNYSVLDLCIYEFIFSISTKRQLELLESTFSSKHPYLGYRGRIYGPIKGLYLQFRAPTDSFPYIVQLAESMKNHGYIDSFEYIEKHKSETEVVHKSALQFWDRTERRWIFDWDNWKKHFKTAPIHSKTKTSQASQLSTLTSFDIALLAELTLDARRKNVDIIRKLNLPQTAAINQKVSRRIRFIKENIISDYRFFISGDYFNLYQSVLIQGFCSLSSARQLRNYLDTPQNTTAPVFPFQNQVKITKDGFLWYVRAPPNHMSELLDFLWNQVNSFKVYFMDHKKTKHFGLWNETYSPETGRWIKDKSFMIDNVLKALKISNAEYNNGKNKYVGL